MDKDNLVKAAMEAQKFARAPYSKFKVGAALLAKDGTITRGSNIESTSYSLTICAERVALVKALSEGIDDFEAIAITAKGQNYVSPCGACRQLLHDYAPDISVILTDGENHKSYKLKELLPLAFDDSHLSDL